MKYQAPAVADSIEIDGQMVKVIYSLKSCVDECAD